MYFDGGLALSNMSIRKKNVIFRKNLVIRFSILYG